MTQTKEERVIDKSTWPAGPWKDEPDRVEFEAYGFPCLITRQVTGHLCGYVGMPPGHPWHGQGYSADALDGVEVHGGLTYASACKGDVCHVPKPGEPDNVFWLGFDMAHYGDFRPADSGRFLPEVLLGPREGGVYRDIPYVRAQCERLALQARARAVAEGQPDFPHGRGDL